MNERIKTNIRDYGEGYTVDVVETYVDRAKETRLVAIVSTESGYRESYVDIVDVLKWVKNNRPELLENLSK